MTPLTSEWAGGVHVLVEDDTETCGYATRQTASGRYLLTPGADGDPESFEAITYGVPNPDGLPVITRDADLTTTAPTTRVTMPDARPRVIPRNRREFAEIRSRALTCVVVSRDNDFREVERALEFAWNLLDQDPKARLIDLGDGTYKVERRPRPLWYLLRPAPDGAAS